jgi:hypothetical protein
VDSEKSKEYKAAVKRNGSELNVCKWNNDSREILVINKLMPLKAEEPH